MGTCSARRHSNSMRALLLTIAVLFLPQRALALAFTPTESEWSTWPAYCQARYMASGAGVDSQFAGRVDAGFVKSWESKLGADVWYSLHHYCAGLILVNRAKAEPDKKQRELTLKHAIEEYHFSLDRIPESHPMYAEVAARRGMAHRELGETNAALQYLDAAIQACRQCIIGYQAKAMFYRAQGQLAQARQVLEEGDSATGGDSAEIHYVLGLVLLDLKEFAASQQHARRAYELGYPLPGLRDRLARAGHPVN